MTYICQSLQLVKTLDNINTPPGDASAQTHAVPARLPNALMSSSDRNHLALLVLACQENQSWFHLRRSPLKLTREVGGTAHQPSRRVFGFGCGFACLPCPSSQKGGDQQLIRVLAWSSGGWICGSGSEREETREEMGHPMGRERVPCGRGPLLYYVAVDIRRCLCGCLAGTDDLDSSGAVLLGL